MSWRRGASLVVGLAAAAGLAAESQAPSPPPQQQTFRASTDVVFVDVSVRDRGRSVTGLRAEDFIVTDNGVRQHVESVEAAAVPIDLTVVVDVSGNPRRPWQRRVPVSRKAADIDDEVRKVARLLRSGDRLRALAVDTRVQQLFPFVAMPPPVIRQVEFDGLGAVYDSMMAALLHPVEPARRHVVIARTKGVDTVSSVDAAALRAVAERSDALFHVVMMESALDAEAALATFQCNPYLMGLCWPKQRSWIPHQRRLIGGPPKRALMPDGRDVAAGAAATGGAVHQTMLLNEPTLTSAFQNALDDFRSGYILRYTPAGVARAGWHDIEVTAAGRPSYTIRARTGYAVESRAPEPAPASPVAVPRRLAEFVDAYSAGRYDDVRAALGRVDDIDELLDEFERGGNPWPATPHREAAFALELTEPAVFSNAAGLRDAGLRLIRRFGRLIRHPLEPDDFERYWHFAALTMLQGALRPEAAEPAVLDALARFPDEPQFVLARAIVNDQRTAMAVGPSADARKSAQARFDVVRQQYRSALAFPEAAVEARIRLAWLEHRTRQHAEALQLLTAAAASPIRDSALAYLQQLFTGHVLVALDRPVEARAAYQNALRLLPAQSARVALMNTLLLQGNTAAAEALAEDIQTARAEAIDPWTMYWQGQYRLYPAALVRLRQLIR